MLFTSISSNGSGFIAICNFTVFNRTRSHHLPLAELWCGADVVCVLCVFSVAVWDEEIDLHHLSTNTLKYSGILGERIGNSKRCYGNSHWKVFIVCISQWQSRGHANTSTQQQQQQKRRKTTQLIQRDHIHLFLWFVIYFMRFYHFAFFCRALRAIVIIYCICWAEARDLLLRPRECCRTMATKKSCQTKIDAI